MEKVLRESTCGKRAPVRSTAGAIRGPCYSHLDDQLCVCFIHLCVTHAVRALPVQMVDLLSLKFQFSCQRCFYFFIPEPPEVR